MTAAADGASFRHWCCDNDRDRAVGGSRDAPVADAMSVAAGAVFRKFADWPAVVITSIKAATPRSFDARYGPKTAMQL